jgi:hypothetical protein
MRACIFCGDKATSLEHAWPLWVVEAIGSTPSFTIQVWFGPDAAEKRWGGKGRSAQVRVRHLCRGCNNGWMSDLEKVAQSAIRPLMNDVSIPLDRPAQHLIAVWSMKTAMVFECTDPTKNWFHKQADRQHVRETLALPVGTMVWVGRFERSNVSFVQGMRLFGAMPENNPVLGDGYLTTFAIGRLVVQLLTVRRKPEFQQRRLTLEVNPGPWDEALRQIWPTAPTVQWPPAVSFSEQDLEKLCKRFTIATVSH